MLISTCHQVINAARVATCTLDTNYIITEPNIASNTNVTELSFGRFLHSPFKFYKVPIKQPNQHLYVKLTICLLCNWLHGECWINSVGIS